MFESSLKPLWWQKDAQVIDHLTSAQEGAKALMERAVKELSLVASKLWSSSTPTLVLTGAGGNGGDGYGLAEALRTKGYPVQVYPLIPAKNPLTVQMAKAYKGEVLTTPPVLTSEMVVVDAVLGMGVSKALKGDLWQQLSFFAQKGVQVLAVDVPSGLCLDNASARAPLPATWTVTFGAKKLCHLLSPSLLDCGEVMERDIGFSEEALQTLESQELSLIPLDPEQVPFQFPLPPAPKTLHKFERGHILVIGGSPGKTGARGLAALGALRSGAGWVSVAGEPDPRLPLEITFEEALVHGKDLKSLVSFIEERRVKALVVGPGMNEGLSPEFFQAVARLQKDQGLFLVFDAHGLEGFFDRAKGCSFSHEKTLLTPHPGEFKKYQLGERELLSKESLMEIVAKLNSFQVSLFYKSQTPLFLGPLGGYLISDPQAGFGKAGMGDLGAGVIASLGARGLLALPAAIRAYAALLKAYKNQLITATATGVIPSDLVSGIGAFLDE